ncbi:MAG TPA: hypothetical protein VGF45_19550, partial [Polyangia bacterium]
MLARDVDAGGHRIRNLGKPSGEGDLTYTDNQSDPQPLGKAASPGKSRLAAPADHVHPAAAFSMPLRVAASGKKVFLAAGARVTLATLKRKEGELFTPGGFLWVRDDANGVTWETEVSGPENISAYHERTGKPDELRFMGHNGSKHGRTIDWATLALAPPG